MDDDDLIALEAAFLVALSERGVGSDVLGMLVHGNGRGTIAPGAARFAIRHLIKTYREQECLL